MTHKIKEFFSESDESVTDEELELSIVCHCKSSSDELDNLEKQINDVDLNRVQPTLYWVS